MGCLHLVDLLLEELDLIPDARVFLLLLGHLVVLFDLCDDFCRLFEFKSQLFDQVVFCCDLLRGSLVDLVSAHFETVLESCIIFLKHLDVVLKSVQLLFREDTVTFSTLLDRADLLLQLEDLESIFIGLLDMLFRAKASE